MTTKTSLIVYSRDDGLGGRLKGLLAGLRMAVKHNIPFVIVWETVAHKYNCPFDILLHTNYYNWVEYNDLCGDYDQINNVMTKIKNNELIYHQSTNENNLEQNLQLHNIELNELNELNDLNDLTNENKLVSISKEELLNIWFDKSKTILKLGAKYEFGNKQINTHDIVVMNGCARFNPKKINKLPIKHIRFPDEILNEIQRFYDQYNLVKGEYIGVHLRRGDFVTLNLIRNIVPEEKYFIEIDKYDKSIGKKLPIFISSESNIVISKFQQKYDSRIIFHPASGYGFNNPTYINDAVVDFVLLSNSQYLIGSVSAFTTMAACIGDIKNPLLLRNKPDDCNSTIFLDYIDQLKTEITNRKLLQNSTQKI